MSPPDIHRVLKTCIVHESKEILLVAGRPPLLRFSESVREMQIDPLTGDDVLALALDSLIPLATDRQHMRDYYDQVGFCRWDYPYDHRTGTRFRVFLIRQAGSHLAIVTPIGPDVPGLGYGTVQRPLY